ncbi:YdcF family protein [Histidinibacterium lentulum]|uniref:YdcF family protein n=1 Tax=Histidinibacterium lentulum TaxID=2480588 RepID=A0A3N2R9U3_9RHOB|nr:YdcF family protein [Histidinibacterium lentulum]ROU04183.1 YdcF family protein [Histidinibacterium lentulum]
MRRLLRTLAGLVLIAVALYGIGFAGGLGSALLTPSCATLKTREARFDLAVVLSSGMQAGGTLGPVTADRLMAGVGLYEAGTVARLHMTGDGLPQSPVSAGGAMRDKAIAEGVPPDLVTAEEHSRSTLESALLSRGETADADTIVLVSSGFHLWRAAASMAWAGTPVDATCHPAAMTDPSELLEKAHYEALRWGPNALRALLWSAADLIGLSERLPDWWLA